MNIREIVKEVGYFETSLNLLPALGSADAAERIAADMPLPSADIGERIEAYAKGIAEKGKKKIFLLTPGNCSDRKAGGIPGKYRICFNRSALGYGSGDVRTNREKSSENRRYSADPGAFFSGGFFSEKRRYRGERISCGRQDNGLKRGVPHDGTLRRVSGAETVSSLCRSAKDGKI